MFDLGTQELIVIFIVAFLVFGPRKLPELGRTLGKGMKELKTAMKGVKESFEEAESDVTGDIKKATAGMEKVAKGFEIPDLKKEALKKLKEAGPDLTGDIKKATAEIGKVASGIEIPDLKKEALKTLNETPTEKPEDKAPEAEKSSDNAEEKQEKKPETGKDG